MSTEEPRAGADGVLRLVEPVHTAETDEEREAIYRFRYTVYVEELGAKIGLDDGGRPWVRDPEDEKPYTTLLYTGAPDDITGTLRVRCWRPGEVPFEWDNSSMELFPGIEGMGVSEAGRLMIKPQARQRFLLGSLFKAMYDVAVPRGVDVLFGNCAPGLLRLYRRVGLRPYAGRLISTPAGVAVPIAVFLADLAYLKRERCLLSHFAELYFGPGKKPPIDVAPFAHLFEAAAAPLVSNPVTVWDRVQHALAGDAGRGWLVEISEATLEKMASAGMLLTVPEGELLLEKGLQQRETFAVVKGLFEVVDDERRLALVGEGDLLGEMAFFGTSGRRTASVRALADSQVLLVERRFLDRLRRSDPASAAEILSYVAGVLADRASPTNA